MLAKLCELKCWRKLFSICKSEIKCAWWNRNVKKKIFPYKNLYFSPKFLYCPKVPKKIHCPFNDCVCKIKDMGSGYLLYVLGTLLIK